MNNEISNSSGLLQNRISKVEEASSEDFLELVRIAELDPAKHLKYADWSGISFKGNDLRGFDFSGANLGNCCFCNARIKGARFDKADIRNTNLRKAIDWQEYVEHWTPPEVSVSDDCLSTFSVFQDAPFAPEMIAIPPGSFEMGSSREEKQTMPIETPRHTVNIYQPLAVGRFAVTSEEWNFAFKGPGEADKPDTNLLPATNISWLEAKQYCAWLNSKTGYSYRLLSEAEWEYVARAGTTTPYWQGETISSRDANFNRKRQSTLPVDSFKPNPWGLYNIHGNVFEWVEDQFFPSYTGAPINGQPWNEKTDCEDKEIGRVIRGGARFSAPQHVRSASRFRRPAGERNQNLGFRVARTLSYRAETDL